MKLTELTPDEEVVLVGLIREIVQADDVYSASESARVAAIRDGLGHERFDGAVARAKERLGSRAELKELAKGVREGARRVPPGRTRLATDQPATRNASAALYPSRPVAPSTSTREVMIVGYRDNRAWGSSGTALHLRSRGSDRAHATRRTRDLKIPRA